MYPESYWNYRLVEVDGIVDIYEVYYKWDRPVARTENPASSMDFEDPENGLSMMSLAYMKDVLTDNDFFYEEGF